MDKKEIQELKKVANGMKPMFNIGKSGVTETLIDMIDKYLDAHGIVKIKSLVAEDKAAVKESAEKIAKEIEAEIVDLKGFTFTIYR